MESAFGIEHGYDEVSKANPFAALGGAMARKTTSIGQGLRVSGKSNIAAGKDLTSKTTPGTFQHSLGQGMQTGGARRVKAGGMLRKFGGAMGARPGLTGGATVGAAGLGAFGLHNRRRF